ncbi:MAG: NADH-quinone oxidoreductase subunit C [Dehalococcoidales bacterium]|nr:NADH-quinone oxidoreductase subunit C [Dehalococcoidales bacterium]MDZ4231149.1 NADH-quinone oxidoreductase subunit C [Dehalococcoidales bacterium]
MTTALSTSEVARRIAGNFPEAVISTDDKALLVRTEAIFGILEHLKTDPEFDFDYLNYITAVDYYDYFEIVYQLTSRQHNHSLVLKTRCYDRENPVVPSVVGLWRGADYQEREIYDLLGINFTGHPNLKRIVLWQGFEGHPLRRDYL